MPIMNMETKDRIDTLLTQNIEQTDDTNSYEESDIGSD